MTRSRWIACAAVLAVCVAAPASAARQTQETPAGEGVVCALFLYTAIAEGGRRCTPGASPETQTVLDEAVAKLDAYMLANMPGMTSEELARLKVEQAGVGAPLEQLCVDGLPEMVSTIEPAQLEQARTFIDDMVARPGTPTLGSCI